MSQEVPPGARRGRGRGRGRPPGRTLQVSIPENGSVASDSESSTKNETPSQTSAPPAKRPRGRPPLSGRNKTGKIGGDKKESPPGGSSAVSGESTPTSSQPTITKAKLGSILREKTAVILSRLMTEDPLSIDDLRKSFPDDVIQKHQIGDILEILRIMGLVIAVQNPDVQPSPSLSALNSTSEIKRNAALYKQAEGWLYTMVNYARGPEAPDSIAQIVQDVEQMQQRAAQAQSRIRSLKRIIADIDSKPDDSHLESYVLNQLQEYMNETKKADAEFVLSDPLHQTVNAAIVRKRTLV